jgi:hypothetical protein
MTEIISRADALSKGLKTYVTGKPCKRGMWWRGGCTLGIVLSA